MTTEEIFEYNKRCAQFLNWEEGQQGSWFKTDDSAKYVVYSEHNNYPHKGLPFHRDWNWIIEVVEAIESLGYLVTIQSNHCHIQEKACKKNAFYPYVISSVYGVNKKDAIVLAIKQFLTWYYESNRNRT